MVTVVGSGNRRAGTTDYEGEDEEEEEDPDPGRGGGGGGGSRFTAAASQTTTSVRLSPSTQPPPNRKRKRPNSNATFADLYMDMMDELRPNPAMVRFRLREVFAGDGDLERGEDEENRQLVFRIEFE